jgi:RHS repeat-associated protein
VNTYDEYGVPGAANVGRFQYTGQIWLSELGGPSCSGGGLYYYKARFYAPCLGRFLQIDPVGYLDQTNLYEYVGSDPLNRTDYKGLYLEQSACTGSRLCEGVGLASGVSGSSTASAVGRLAAATLFAASGAPTGVPDTDIEEYLDNALTFRQLGEAGEAAAVSYLVDKGDTILAQQLYVRTPLGLRIVDIVVREPSGRVVAYEVKAGSAVRSSMQYAKDYAIWRDGGEVRSLNKRGFEQGSRVQFGTGILNVRCASSIGVCL